jgi:predicted RNA-binding Zn ribbon-like protein
VAAVFHKHVTAPIPDPRIFDPDMPEDLLRFIRRNLAKKPQDRFASAAESADFLRAAGDSSAGELIELSTLTMSYLPSRRSQVQLILREAVEKLRRVRGVQVLSAHQTADRTAEEAMPHAPGSD